MHRLIQEAEAPPAQEIQPNKKTSDTLTRWQNKLFTRWDFKGLERRIPLFTAGHEVAGALFPALHVERDRGGVSLTFESDKAKAGELNRQGTIFLYQLHFSDQFKNLKKYCHTSLSGPSSFWISNMLGNRKKASAALLDFIMRSVFTKNLETIPGEETFHAEIKKVQQMGLYEKGRELCDTVLLVLRKRREVSDHIVRFAALARQSNVNNTTQNKEYETLLEEILPADFLMTKTAADLEGCPRFFQALMIRIERAHANPAKDHTKAKQLEPYLQRLNTIPNDCSVLPHDCREEISRFQAMVQEFRVMTFAPELKGGMVVSAKKLKLQWQAVQSHCPGV